MSGLIDLIERLRRIGLMTGWAKYASPCQEEVPLTAAAVDTALPTVTVAGIPDMAVVSRAIATFFSTSRENTNAGANKLNGAQNLQIRAAAGPGAWNNCINLLDDQFGTAGSSLGAGVVVVGQVDVSAVVTGNAAYNFRWALAQADLANLNFNDVQVVLEVWWTV